ncbi:MAG: hypothetical protein HOP30_10285 [Cyclobacteriaceae bacterium]|nr:hypothetical protein [Cyclobacteriaceae bacterium]
MSSQVHAQRKFRDLFPLLSQFSAERQKNELKEYLSTDANHPNANFRLALLYEANYKNADPLIEYKFAMANAEQAINLFFKSKILLDEKELKHNVEYYAPIFKALGDNTIRTVEFDRVASKINSGYDSALLFRKKIPAIYLAFTKSVNFYDQAVRTFAAVTEEFSTIEDLYMLYDERLDHQLTNIKLSYDSSVIYLNKYLELTSKYPIKRYQPTFQIQPVVTYRLDGLLTTINFLGREISLWNYADWVNQVRAKVNGEVADMRKKMEITNRKMDENLAYIKESATGFPIPEKVDKQLRYNLNRMDRQSALLSLLDYKEYKQEIEVEAKSKTLDTLPTVRNAELLSEFIYQNRRADTLLNEFSKRISDLKVKKHHQFVNTTYGGATGLKSYASTQQAALQVSYLNHKAVLRKNVASMNIAESCFSNKDEFIKFNRITIPLVNRPLSPESLELGLLFTKFNKKNPDGSAYVAGIYKASKKNLISTYVVRINPDGRIAWFKDVSISIDSAANGDSHCYLASMVLTQEGPAMLTRSIHASRGDVINTFVCLNEKGEERIRKKIESTAYPRALLYIEQSNSFTLVLKGLEEKENYNSMESIDVLGVNTHGDLIWKNTGISLAGTFTDIVTLSDGYLLAGSYSTLNDQNGQEARAKFSGGEYSPYLIKLNERGVTLFLKPLSTNGIFYVHKLIKTNDMSIHLLGNKESMETGVAGSLNGSDNYLHIMTNRFGQCVSESN